MFMPKEKEDASTLVRGRTSDVTKGSPLDLHAAAAIVSSTLAKRTNVGIRRSSRNDLSLETTRSMDRSKIHGACFVGAQ